VPESTAESIQNEVGQTSFDSAPIQNQELYCELVQNQRRIDFGALTSPNKITSNPHSAAELIQNEVGQNLIDSAPIQKRESYCEWVHNQWRIDFNFSASTSPNKTTASPHS
jgi:hypothetical protein